MEFLVKLSKTIISIVLLALLAIVATSVSVVYNFEPTQPFCGDKIYNPYRNFDKSVEWKRANFHTHTRVEGVLNECEYTPSETLAAYDKFGYDIVTISNHNAITDHPTSDTRVYEHGYNIAKFHKLVFGSQKEWWFDNLLPIFAFQKQFQIDRLKKQSDIVVLNHPMRTHTMWDKQLAQIGGYNIIELDSGKSTENSYWDAALSAGRYSFGIANDDLHYPDRTRAIAIRSNFIAAKTDSYSDIKEALIGGCYYSMRVPDYGGGDWQVKVAKNRVLPYVKNIGIAGDAPFVALSEVADSIKVTGQNHTTLLLATATDSVGYTMRSSDPYCRFTAYFADGEVVYTNPFARYDDSSADSPFKTVYSANIVLTILFNFIIFALIFGVITLLYKIIMVW